MLPDATKAKLLLPTIPNLFNCPTYLMFWWASQTWKQACVARGEGMCSTFCPNAIFYFTITPKKPWNQPLNPSQCACTCLNFVLPHPLFTIHRTTTMKSTAESAKFVHQLVSNAMLSMYWSLPWSQTCSIWEGVEPVQLHHHCFEAITACNPTNFFINLIPTPYREKTTAL